VDALLEERLATGTNATWMTRLEAAGVPAAPVLGVDEILAHPQLVARDMIVQVDHPGGEPPRLSMLGNPMRQPDVEHQPYAPAPRLGQHTDALLGGLLGLSAVDLAGLRARGVC
jgi:formyl-CoA transferase